MASSFDQQQKLNQLIAGENDPNMTTIDILSSLKLISHFETQINDNKDAATSLIAKEELKYLTAGMNALKSNPSLSTRFGSGFQGAMSIAGLLKTKQSERVYNSIIGNILDQNEMTVDEGVANVNSRGGGGGAISE
jgi:hypothetical protein